MTTPLSATIRSAPLLRSVNVPVQVCVVDVDTVVKLIETLQLGSIDY